MNCNDKTTQANHFFPFIKALRPQAFAGRAYARDRPRKALSILHTISTDLLSRWSLVGPKVG